MGKGMAKYLRLCFSSSRGISIFNDLLYKHRMPDWWIRLDHHWLSRFRWGFTTIAPNISSFGISEPVKVMSPEDNYSAMFA